MFGGGFFDLYSFLAGGRGTRCGEGVPRVIDAIFAESHRWWHRQRVPFRHDRFEFINMYTYYYGITSYSCRFWGRVSTAVGRAPSRYLRWEFVILRGGKSPPCLRQKEHFFTRLCLASSRVIKSWICMKYVWQWIL